MSTTTSKLVPLTDKQLPIVYMALVFGFVTISAVMNHFNWSYDAVTGTLGARRRGKWLQPRPIRYGLTGFQPTLAAARELGANPSLVRPLAGVQSILPRFAVLTDCTNPGRRVLPYAFTSIKIEELRSDDYRLIPGEVYPVCYAHSDCGREPMRLLHKANSYFRRFRQIDYFRELIESNKFAVRILTPSEGKAKAIADQFTKRKASGPIEIAVIPQMQDFLA
jgi:hypothetical protein